MSPHPGEVWLADLTGKAMVIKGTQAKACTPSALIERQALHAYRLQFVHPLKFHRMILEAPPPEDMVKLAELLRRHRAVRG